MSLSSECTTKTRREKPNRDHGWLQLQSSLVMSTSESELRVRAVIQHTLAVSKVSVRVIKRHWAVQQEAVDCCVAVEQEARKPEAG
eukprot:scaffold64191_cov72-Cyclotella_meneghiniana.AAC.1